MATATQPISSILTLDEYLQSSYDPDCDFVDDHIEERNLGEREHSILQVAIGAWFFNRRSEWKIVPMSEQRTRVSSTRVRLPDICLVHAHAPKEKITQTPPVLAIEILSPEDRMSRVIRRLNEFLAMGVQNVWVIDPIDRVAFDYSERSLRLVEEARLTIPHSPIYLDLPEIFSALDQ